MQGNGIGRYIMNEIISYARRNNKKAVRLDILDKNYIAEALYTSIGFKFVQTKKYIILIQG